MTQDPGKPRDPREGYPLVNTRESRIRLTRNNIVLFLGLEMSDSEPSRLIVSLRLCKAENLHYLSQTSIRHEAWLNCNCP